MVIWMFWVLVIVFGSCVEVNVCFCCLGFGCRRFVVEGLVWFGVFMIVSCVLSVWGILEEWVF